MISHGIAAAQWSEPQIIASDPDVYQVSAAVQEYGAAVMVYVHQDDANSQMWIEGNARVDGKWGSPQQISAKMSNGSFYPKAAIDPSGFSYALWKYSEGGMEGLKSANLPYGFDYWLQAGDFPDTFATSIDQFEITLTGRNFATAVWSVERNGNFYIEAAQFDRISHRWTTISSIPLSGRCKSFDVKLDSQGLTWLTWTLFSYSDHKDVIYITSLQGGDTQWAPIQTLIKGADVEDLKLAIDPKDNVLVRWHQTLNGRYSVFQAFKKHADSIAWVGTEFPTLKNEYSLDSEVTIDRQGNIMLIWDQTTDVISSMVLPARSLIWSKPTIVSKEFTITWESAIDKAGNRLVALNNENYLQAETLAAGSTKWSAPFQITPLKYINSNIYSVALVKDTAIIIYEDDDTVKVIEGTSLF